MKAFALLAIFAAGYATCYHFTQQDAQTQEATILYLQDENEALRNALDPLPSPTPQPVDTTLI